MRSALAILLVLAGCQKEGAGAGAASVMDFPTETTAMVGFVRKGPAPSAAELSAAVIALIGETNHEIAAAIGDCVAPVSAHLERTTLAVVGNLKDERVVVRASGPGLRGALEACITKMLEKQGQKLVVRDEGKQTLYALGAGDPMIAVWSGQDSVVVAARPELIDATLAATGGLRGSPIEKALAEIDTSSAIWLAAAGPHLPEEAEMERVAGAIKDLTGSVHATFKSPEAAARAAKEVEELFPKGVKVTGSEMTIGVNAADFPSLFTPQKRREGTAPPPLKPDYARAIVAAGPLIFALFLLADDAKPVEAPAAVPSEPVLPEPPQVAPPAEPAAPTPP